MQPTYQSGVWDITAEAGLVSGTSPSKVSYGLTAAISVVSLSQYISAMTANPSTVLIPNQPPVQLTITYTNPT